MQMLAHFRFLALVGAIAVATISASPAQSCGDNSFCAAYFDNRFLRGQAVRFAQFDRSFDLHWGTGDVGDRVCVKNCGKGDSLSPVYDTISYGIGRDNFSVRFEGSFEFDGGDYQFVVGSDDGIRMYIDDGLVVDRWFDRSYKEEWFVQRVPQGRHRVRLDFYEHGGSAHVKLSWHRL